MTRDRTSRTHRAADDNREGAGGIGLIYKGVDYVEARWDSVRADFDEARTERLPADRIAAAFAKVVDTVGPYERMDGPFVRRQGDDTVVRFDPRGRVAGLFVLRPDAA